MSPVSRVLKRIRTYWIEIRGNQAQRTAHRHQAAVTAAAQRGDRRAVIRGAAAWLRAQERQRRYTEAMRRAQGGFVPGPGDREPQGRVQAGEHRISAAVARAYGRKHRSRSESPGGPQTGADTGEGV